MTTETIATRTTFDGCTLFFHADGKVSTRSMVYFGRLPVAMIFTVADAVCTYTEAEIPTLIRDAAAGRFPQTMNRGTGRLDAGVLRRLAIKIIHRRAI